MAWEICSSVFQKGIELNDISIHLCLVVIVDKAQVKHAM